MSDFGNFRRHIWAVPFELVMLGGVVVTASLGDRLHVATSVFTFIVSFAPLAFERLVKVRLPAILQFIYVAFIFGSMFSGEVLGMYGHYWPWDDITHCVYGVLSGLAGAILINSLHREGKVKMPTWLQVVTIVGMGVSVATLWEIVEFSSDGLFRTFSQGGDLEDTMFDLIDGFAGVTVVALLYVGHLRGKNIPILSGLIASYQTLNKKRVS